MRSLDTVNRKPVKWKDDAEMVQSLEIFQRHINGQLNKEIANTLGITTYQVSTAIKKSRDHYYESLLSIGHKYFADIWKRYEWIFNQAQIEWEQTKDPVLLKEMRGALAEMKKMMGLDAPPKAAVNEQGKAVPDKLILIMDTGEYERREAEYRKQMQLADPNVIDGTILQLDDAEPTEE